MKKQIILFIFLVFTLFTGKTQDWQPINMGNRYLYTKDISNSITDAIWVDSVHVQGSDSIFFFNLLGKSDYSIMLIVNQAGFLGRKCIKKTNGTYVFQGNKNFTLLPYANLNTTWVWDSVQAVTATITQIDTIHRFGLIDSVKTILLSTGQTCILSKTLGFLKWQNYALKGIPTQGLGQDILHYKDFFLNMQVGDSYCFQGQGGDPGACGQYFFGRKHKVLSKTVYSDSITINIQQNLVYIFNHCIWAPYYSPPSYSTYTNNPQEPYNRAYPDTYQIYPDTSMSGFFSATLYQSTSNDITITYFYSSFPSLSDTIYFYNVKRFVYEIDHGIVGYSGGNWESGEEYHLTSVSSSPCPYFLSLSPPQLNKLCAIYPNPASDRLYLYYNNPQLQNCVFTIRDMTGREIVSQTALQNSTTYEIVTRDWAAGLYFVRVQDENGNFYSEKFVKE